jgi:non-specific serine/threonine protein kinase
MGGIGKSRLAHETAMRLKPAFTGGVWVIDLAVLDDPLLLDAAVARTLGIHQRSPDLVREQIARRLGGSCLLILDNCEHLVEACVELTEWLLPRSPGLRIVATSRTVLGARGETVLRLPELDLPEPSEASDAHDLRRYSAIRLFVERASAVDERFELNDDDAGLVAAICRRVEGVPLALELAASRVGTLTLPDLLFELDDQLGLTSFNPRVSPRHESMRATLDWSHGQMPLEEQILWRRLSIFVGGFTLDGARAVAADVAAEPHELESTLSALVRKSIVLLDSRCGRERYRLLETLRLYGQEKLNESGELPNIRAQHLSWCSTLVLDDAWWTGDEQLLCMQRLTNEHGNVAAALNYALGANPEAGLTLLGRIFIFWGLSGWYGELRHYTDHYLDRVSAASDPRMLVLFAAGLSAAWYNRDLEKARRCFGELARPSKESSRTQALASFGFGVCDVVEERYEEARKHLTRAIALLERTGGPVLLAASRYQLALTATLGNHDLDGARALLETTLEQVHPDDVWNQAGARMQLGLIEWRSGNDEAAEDNFRRAVQLQAALGHVWGIASSMEGLAALAASRGEPIRAAQLLGAAHRIWEHLHSAVLPGLAADHARAEQAARNALGSTRYDAIRRASNKLELDDAIALVLEQGAKPKPESQSILTPREIEIARLVAGGATNGEISFQLMISKETVKTHIRNMLHKLGFTSRVQIGAWYAREIRGEGTDLTHNAII